MAEARNGDATPNKKGDFEEAEDRENIDAAYLMCVRTMQCVLCIVYKPAQRPDAHSSRVFDSGTHEGGVNQTQHHRETLNIYIYIYIYIYHKLGCSWNNLFTFY